mgnify:CR=1 FL=1
MNYFSLPGIIGERLYSLFDLNKMEYIKVEDFITGMTNLYTGDFNYLCQFVFDLYDFDKDGLISKEDVRIVLSYIPLRKTKIETAIATIGKTGLTKINGGVIPRIKSRITPPPIAVTTPRITTPKISSFFSIATKEPETANATTPII